jgi:hypothetical protein
MSVIIDGSAGVTTNAGGSVNPSTTIDGINFSCRAFVNFNGIGTVAIRSSGNVSSITDNGTGDYTVNFTTAMTDANYNTSFGGQQDDSSTPILIGLRLTNDSGTGASVTTSAIRLLSAQGSTATDIFWANVAIFR